MDGLHPTGLSDQDTGASSSPADVVTPAQRKRNDQLENAFARIRLQRPLTAIHEAAHVVAGCLGGLGCNRARIEPSFAALGAIGFSRHDNLEELNQASYDACIGMPVPAQTERLR